MNLVLEVVVKVWRVFYLYFLVFGCTENYVVLVNFKVYKLVLLFG